jgi:hypothetical protein
VEVWSSPLSLQWGLVGERGGSGPIYFPRPASLFFHRLILCAVSIREEATTTCLVPRRWDLISSIPNTPEETPNHPRRMFSSAPMQNGLEGIGNAKQALVGWAATRLSRCKAKPPSFDCGDVTRREESKQRNTCCGSCCCRRCRSPAKGCVFLVSVVDLRFTAVASVGIPF